MVSNDFNRNSEKVIGNRISPYNLTENEKTAVWKEVQQRNEALEQEKNDYNNDDIYTQRLTDEKERLKAEQQPNTNYQLNPPGVRPNNIPRQAQINVQRNHLNELQNINKTCDSNINNILDQARAEGRGPDMSYKNVLTQDFDRVR